MTAQEAKKLTEDSLINNTTSELNRIFDFIMKSAAEGKSEINYSSMHQLVKNKLIELGYKVEYMPGDFRASEQSQSYYKIKW